MIPLSLLVLLAAPDAQVQTVVDAIAEPNCPRLFGMLAPGFQQAVPEASWPGWCASVGKLENVQPLERPHEFRATSPGGPVRFMIAFGPKGRVTGLAVKPAPEIEVPATASTEALLQAVRDRYGVPALAAWVGKPGEVLTSGVVGVRKSGDATKAATSDRWHLGSDTKAMTATLAALLVEEKKLRWNSTITEVFPDWKDVRAEYRDVTLEELLTCRSGLPGNISEWPKRVASDAIVKRRAMVARAGLRDAPVKPRGTFSYSNLGYIVAGAMIERVLKRSWEEALTQRVFKPLGMTSCGFGAPASAGKVDQPWAHRDGTPVNPGPESDNPPELGPAGTVHCALEDWAKFASLHVRGEKTKLLSAASFVKLHTAPEGSSYAMGWLTGSRTLSHDGSNTMFYASAWLGLEKNLIVLVTANAADERAQKAVSETVRLLVERQ